jgi:hypothetical protein
VEQIKDSIKAQKEDIMGSDIFNILVLCDHIELRQDGQGFKPDGKGPEYTIKCEVCVHNEPQG